MNVVDGLFYTKEHEWIKIEGKQARMGITDHAQVALGDITFIELPSLDTQAQQFKRIATVESVKAASDVYAPISGKVTAINEEINQHPEMINQSPYEKGWFLVIEIAQEKEKDNLLTADAYRSYLEESS